MINTMRKLIILCIFILSLLLLNYPIVSDEITDSGTMTITPTAPTYLLDTKIPRYISYKFTYQDGDSPVKIEIGSINKCSEYISEELSFAGETLDGLGSNTRIRLISGIQGEATIYYEITDYGRDFDCDEIPDDIDLDDDNDNYSDEKEIENGTDPYDAIDYPSGDSGSEIDDIDNKTVSNLQDENIDEDGVNNDLNPESNNSNNIENSKDLNENDRRFPGFEISYLFITMALVLLIGLFKRSK
jgi:hypothetical protein